MLLRHKLVWKSYSTFEEWEDDLPHSHFSKTRWMLMPTDRCSVLKRHLPTFWSWLRLSPSDLSIGVSAFFEGHYWDWTGTLSGADASKNSFQNVFDLKILRRMNFISGPQQEKFSFFPLHKQKYFSMSHNRSKEDLRLNDLAANGEARLAGQNFMWHLLSLEILFV